MERDKATIRNHPGKVKRAIATVFATVAILVSPISKSNISAAPAPVDLALL